MFRSQNEMELVHFLYRLIPKSLNVLQGSSNYFSLIIREILLCKRWQIQKYATDIVRRFFVSRHQSFSVFVFCSYKVEK